MIHAPLSHRLQVFAETKLAQASLSRILPPDFSQRALIDSLSELRRHLPPSPLNSRMLGEPEFLRGTPIPRRVREWELSRYVLLEALEGLPLDDTLRFSFSHTEDAALAIAVSGVKVGIGADLERASREISDAAFARFSRTEEEAFLKDRLGHWVLKEACFKAHPRSDETIIADYVITGCFENAGEVEYAIQCTKGNPERFRATLGTIDEYSYGFALLL